MSPGPPQPTDLGPSSTLRHASPRLGSSQGLARGCLIPVPSPSWFSPALDTRTTLSQRLAPPHNRFDVIQSGRSQPRILDVPDRRERRRGLYANAHGLHDVTEFGESLTVSVVRRVKCQGPHHRHPYSCTTRRQRPQRRRAWPRTYSADITILAAGNGNRRILTTQLALISRRANRSWTPRRRAASPPPD